MFEICCLFYYISEFNGRICIKHLTFFSFFCICPVRLVCIRLPLSIVSVGVAESIQISIYRNRPPSFSLISNRLECSTSTECYPVQNSTIIVINLYAKENIKLSTFPNTNNSLPLRDGKTNIHGPKDKKKYTLAIIDLVTCKYLIKVYPKHNFNGIVA